MDILFENGTIRTLERNSPDAQALLVRNGRIAAVGGRTAVEDQTGIDVRRVDLAGRTLLPAFLDAHSHFTAVANQFLQVSLEGCTSWADMQDRIRDYIRRERIPAGQWVTAQGYDHNLLSERRHPDRLCLDAAAPDNPVVICHQSGHMGVFNTAALERLGVTAQTPAPAGGVIGRENGTLTGYMEENAFLEFQKRVPMRPLESFLAAYRKAQDLYASYGITTVQEGLLRRELVPLYQALLADGSLKLDVVAYGDPEGAEAARQAFPESVRQYHRRFKLGGYKMFLDGSPQGRTAWLRRPYQGEQEYRGYGTLTDAEVLDMVRRAGTDGMQLLAHCNGDAACAQYLAALDAAPGQLEDARAQIAQQEKTLAEGEAQLAAGEAEYQKQAAVLREAEKEIASGKTSLSMAPALAQLQMQLAEEQLEEAKAEVTDGKAQLEEAKQQLADGKAELDDAKQQLADGEQALAELEVPEWFLLTRSENVSYASFEMNIEKVDAVAKVFPVFFFLVAALVALTTMTRMVEEDRLQIGTLKALGYGKGSIMAKYLLYALAASVLGSAFGLAVGLTLLPTVIWNAYTMMYELPKLYCLFNARFALFSSLTAIACVLAATLNACWATLHEVPAQLMLPRAPKAGKRIFLEHIPFIWRRMKFTHKVAARNLLRYKKRFFMTVTGIAGCTALLLTGFGLHDSISDIVYKQFGDIFLYDVSITVKDAAKAESGALADVLADGDAVKDALLVHQEKITSHFNGEAFSTYLMVPENSAGFPDFVDLRTRKGGTPVPFSETGVVITEKMAERGGFSIGSQITLENADGDTGTFTVDGIAENYVENYVYLSAETYEHGFGAAPVFNTVLAISADPSGEGRDALSARLLGTDGVSSVSFTSDLKTSFSGMLQKIDIIVVVLIVAAGLLAYVVLYNLTNINIAERVKEIATIKVLGFYDKEVYAYVYRENIVLSLIGTLTGLVLGIFLHMFVIYTVEVDATMFGRSIKFWSYAASAGLTILFSLLVNLAMRRKLRNISMVESMKAPE